MSKNCQLKDISKIISSGVTPSRQNNAYWENGTIPWLKTEQLGSYEIYETSEKVTELALKETSLKKYPINTLSIAMYGEGKTRGNVSILKSEMTTNQACCNVVVDEQKANYRYVYYFLKTQYSQLRRLSSGIRNNLNSNDIKEFEIRLPDSLEKQKQISSVLSSLDSKIELNNHINSNLEAMAKTLYDYWFVQFDFPFDFTQGKPCPEPVEGPKTEGRPYKSSGGKMVWNEELKREIPEGWELKELADVATTIMRGISPSYREEGGICVLNQKCIRDKSISFVPSRRHDNELKDANSRLIEYGDVLVNSTGFGTLGRVAIVKRLKEPITVVDSHITIVRSESENIKKLFLGYSMLIRQSEIEGLAEGSTGQTELSRVNLGKLKMVIPPIELQSVFENFINPQFQKMANNEAENEQLSELRDWLLPKLMNGQVTVGDSAENKASYKIEEEMRMAAEPDGR